MYGLVAYQLSGTIHAGIQYGHAVVEYGLRNQDESKTELDKLGLESMSNFGQKMGVAMSALKGKADGNDVKAVLQANYLT